MTIKTLPKRCVIEVFCVERVRLTFYRCLYDQRIPEREFGFAMELDRIFQELSRGLDHFPLEVLLDTCDSIAGPLRTCAVG